MSTQERTLWCSGNQNDTSNCEQIGRMLSQITDKWTLLIMRALGQGPTRFNALRREVGDVSHKVLTSSLRSLEENGFVLRTVVPATPVQVEYSLTELGQDFLGPITTLSMWVVDHMAQIEGARAHYADTQK